MTTSAALHALRAKLTSTRPRPDEPIFNQLYDECIDTADYDGWVPGGIGRVMQEMERDTRPAVVPEKFAHLAATREPRHA